MTKARFMALSDEEAFNMCFKGVVEGEQDNRGQGSHNFMIERQPYQLEFKNQGGYHLSCKLCGKNGCKGCLVPFLQNETVQDCFDKMAIQTNDTLFN